MKRFLVLAGLSVLASVLALLVCCLGIWIAVGPQGVYSATVAGIISLPIGVLMVLYICVCGFTTASLLFGPLLRVSLTLGLGTAVAWWLDVWNQPYFFTLGVIYLANLVIETWLVYEQNRKTSRAKTSAVS